MKFPTLTLAVALTLAGCSTDGPVATPTDTTGTSASPSPSPTASVSASTSPSASDSATPIEAENPVQPSTGAPGSVASLDAMTPEEFGAALIAVDGATGTVSWWDGFDWKSYQVDASLDNQAWATDGHGGLLVQSADADIWHLAPFSDEPVLLLEAPPQDGVFQSLVGGGVIDGRQYAYVERSTYDSPETAAGDILGFDVDGRADRTLLTGTSGWESGTGQVAFINGKAVMTVHAECFTFVVIRELGGSQETQNFVDGQECEGAISGVGESFLGPSAIAVVDSIQGDLPATMVIRALDEADATSIVAMPMHDEPWYRLTSTGPRTLVASQGVAVVHEQGYFRRLELAAPGIVAVADDLAIG